MSYRSLAGLGPVRRALAILFRTAVDHADRAGAGRAPVGPADRPADDDVPARRLQQRPREQQKAALDYVTEASKKRRRDDLAGVVVFGKEPRVEVPPGPSELNLLGIESTIDPENTDLGAAVKLALATFPEDTARRIVDPLRRQREPRQPARAGPRRQVAGRAGRRPADRVLLRPRGPGREGLDPPRRQEGRDGQHQRRDPRQRADPRHAPDLPEGRQLPGAGRRQRAARSRSSSSAGSTSSRSSSSSPSRTSTRSRAEFIPEKGSGDRRAINNIAEGFTHARGKAQVLLIEGTAGEHAELVKALREKEIEVKVLVAPRIDGSGGVGGDPLPTDLAQLQPYDAVILANVPKEAFTESQHQLLASNCHDMGAGLVMLGGRDSFGAGGWMNTPVEKALPVDMQIKALKVQGIGAMVLIMHASEIAEGNYWQKVVAKAAINALSSYDYAGHAPLGGPGGLAVHASGRSATGRSTHAPRHRPHDARRHARLRPVAPDGHEGAQRASRTR